MRIAEPHFNTKRNMLCKVTPHSRTPFSPPSIEGVIFLFHGDENEDLTPFSCSARIGFAYRPCGGIRRYAERIALLLPKAERPLQSNPHIAVPYSLSPQSRVLFFISYRYQAYVIHKTFCFFGYFFIISFFYPGVVYERAANTDA